MGLKLFSRRMSTDGSSSLPGIHAEAFSIRLGTWGGRPVSPRDRYKTPSLPLGAKEPVGTVTLTPGLRGSRY